VSGDPDIGMSLVPRPGRGRPGLLSEGGVVVVVVVGGGGGVNLNWFE
jgi:hypothetical protein